LIASKFFFSGEHADDLTTVQFVYMAVAGLGVIVALAFFFTKLPEVSEEALQAEAEALAHAQGIDSGLDKPFWKQVRPITGFVAQFLYVGAQVTIGSFFLFYTDKVAGIPDSTGSQLLSYGLITFTVCRFIGTALLSVVAAPVLLAFCAAGALVMVICIGSLHGVGGVVCLIAVMGFESIMYPVIFVLGTTGLGHHTRRAAGLLVMGVAGGAVLPPIQGAISDNVSVKSSFFICIPCFAYIFGWAIWIWHKDGRRWTPAKDNREIEREVEAASGSAYPAAQAGLNYNGEKPANYEGSIKEDLERVERA
jgi:FHS family L-fucose permease-like MFS transporter